MNQHPQIGVWQGDIQTVGKCLDNELIAHQRFEQFDLIYRDNDIQIKTYHRLRIGVDRLPANHAIPNMILRQQIKELLQ